MFLSSANQCILASQNLSGLFSLETVALVTGSLGLYDLQECTALEYAVVSLYDSLCYF